MKDEHRSVLQEQLTSLIMRVLVNNPDLHYYQVGLSAPDLINWEMFVLARHYCRIAIFFQLENICYFFLMF